MSKNDLTTFKRAAGGAKEAYQIIAMCGPVIAGAIDYKATGGPSIWRDPNTGEPGEGSPLASWTALGRGGLETGECMGAPATAVDDAKTAVTERTGWLYTLSIEDIDRILVRPAALARQCGISLAAVNYQVARGALTQVTISETYFIIKDLRYYDYIEQDNYQRSRK